jgi:hypothetical protein
MEIGLMNTKPNDDATALSSQLYITEAANSKKQSEEDLQASDPSDEEAKKLMEKNAVTS